MDLHRPVQAPDLMVDEVVTRAPVVPRDNHASIKVLGTYVVFSTSLYFPTELSSLPKLHFHFSVV
jgi:hypothetical protein